MKEELENKLEERFPFMRCALEYEVGDGWYPLLVDLCTEITAAYEKAGIPIDLKPLQIKEKFGSLRFYYRIEGREQETCALDLLGGGSLRFAPNDTPLYQELSEIVNKWEEKSETVCEVCGKAGRLREDLYWILTLCDECYEKERNKN